MDTSKEYIKMCEKADEIQKYRNEKDSFDIGDVVLNPYCLGGATVHTVSGFLKTGDIIWLPRQDQLQDMVSDKWTIQEMLLVFDGFIFPHSSKWTKESAAKRRKYASQFILSMEQLWLAFVMKEKFNKKWNGKVWEGNEICQ